MMIRIELYNDTAVTISNFLYFILTLFNLSSMLIAQVYINPNFVFVLQLYLGRDNEFVGAYYT